MRERERERERDSLDLVLLMSDKLLDDHLSDKMFYKDTHILKINLMVVVRCHNNNNKETPVDC